MGLVDRIRPHRSTPATTPGAAPAHPAEGHHPVAAAERAAAAVLHRLTGTCPHCHKPQQVESATTWVTTPCSYCSAPVTLHA